MQINTKFNVGDTIFFLSTNRICSAQVKTVRTVNEKIEYDCGRGSFLEANVFASKLDVIAALANEAVIEL